MPKLYLTDRVVEKLPYTGPGKQALYYDDGSGATRGLAVRVTRNSKCFVFERWLAGRTVRIKIDDVSVLSVSEARRAVERIAATAAVTGVDPVAQKKQIAADQAKGITFGAAARQYLVDRKIAERTRADYGKLLDDQLAGIAETPIVRLTGDQLLRLHRELSKRSARRANYALVFARAVINTVADDLEIRNPVRELTKKRAWNRETRRRGHLKPQDIAAFWRATETPPGPLHIRSKPSRDYLRFILLTGCRRSEAADLDWSEVDLRHKTVTILDPKNHDDLVLPLSAPLYDMFLQTPKERRKGRVFPRTDDPRRTVGAIGAAIGQPLTIHDLRRSFATIADELRISTFMVKALLNHRQRDVTGGYVQTPVERMREPMEQIAAYVLAHAQAPA